MSKDFILKHYLRNPMPEMSSANQGQWDLFGILILNVMELKMDYITSLVG